MPAERQANAKFCSESCMNRWHNAQRPSRRLAVKAALPRTCKICDREIQLNLRSDAKYCSLTCRDAAKVAQQVKEKRERRLLLRSGRICAWCGDEIPANRTARAKYCSRDCSVERDAAVAHDRRSKAKANRSCQWCDDKIPDSRPSHAIYCSRWCATDASNARKIADDKAMRAAIRAASLKTCPECQGSFAPQFIVTQVYCSRSCQEREASRRWAQVNPDSIRSNKHIRRAREKSVQYEVFSASEIFERDRWICQICGHSVPRDTRHPDPLSPSLDHIIPISKGGPHIATNAQLAHLTCNLRKHDRI